MNKINKKEKLIGIIAISLVVVILTLLISTNWIIKNDRFSKEGYFKSIANANSNLVAGYIKKGITIGGVEGTLEILDTSDATAKEKDIAWGKTGYVNGIKITGTRIDTVAQGKEWSGYFNKNTNLSDDLDNNIVIPEGFKIAQDSGTKVEDGVVIEDKSGNQFVWIPAKTGTGINIHTTLGDKTSIYQRFDYTIASGEGNYSNYKEEMPQDEKKSVDSNGGYYIARFESGDKETTDAKKVRSEGDSQTNTLTIKKGQTPYNYITYENCITLAEGLATKQSYNCKTKMSSAYAWDTAIKFIEIKNSDYGTNSPEGNFIDTSFEYIDIAGNKQTKAYGTSTLVPTGQTTPVCNIYDMGGNLWERTTETTTFSESPVTDRGGSYNWSVNSFSGSRIGSAGIRGHGEYKAGWFLTFRVTLYL